MQGFGGFFHHPLTMIENETGRRGALQRVALILGGVLSPELTAGLMGQVLHIGQRVPVTEENTALLAEIADVIIPETDTPGAKAAGAEQFIVRVLRDCYAFGEQEEFYGGLGAFREECKKRFSKPFALLDVSQKREMVLYSAKHMKGFFSRMRTLTVAGYFQSEIGATKALEFVLVPGRFEGSVPMKPGQKAWAI